MNLYQKPKTCLGKYKINEIAYFSKRNYRVVATRFGILICYASTGEEFNILPSPKSEVLSVAISPEGNMIAGGKADNTIQLWSFDNSSSYHMEEAADKEHILNGHDGSVTSIVFSPDGSILASGSDDGTIRLWEASGGSHKSTLEHGSVTSIVFSPDSKMLASGSNNGTIRLWESETRFGKNRCITTLDEPKIDVYPTIFISDNSQKAVTSVAFSLNDSILASGYSDGTIYLWDIRTLIPFVKRDSNEDRLFWHTNRDLSKNRIALEKKHTDSIQSLDFNSDGRTLASGSKDQTICIWDTKASQHLATLKKHTNTVFSVVFQGKQPINEDRSQYAARSESTEIQDNQLVSESTDGSIRFWNTETGENEKTLVGGYIGNIESVVFSPNGQVLASIGNKGWRNTIIYFWDINTGKIKNSITTEVAGQASFYFSPDSRTFISKCKDSYTDGKETIYFWDVNTGKIKTPITEKIKNLGYVHFSRDNRTLIDSSGTFWDIDTDEQKATITEKIENPQKGYFSPDGKTLLTIEKKKKGDRYGYSRESTSESIHLWDTNTGKRKRSISNEKETFESVRFSPDSETLLTIGTQREVDRLGYAKSEVNSGRKISLWNIDTGERKHSITCEMETFKSIRFSPDSKIFVTIGTQKKDDPYAYSRARESSNENIHLWDASTGEQKATITEKIENLKFSPDSKTLVGLTNSKTYFWDIETGKFRNTRSTKSISNAESIIFSSDSRLLLSVSTKKVNDESNSCKFCFWDVETGEPVSTHLKEMSDNIESVTFNSDKTKFATVHSDNFIRLWDVNTGKHQSTFSGAQEDITSVAFSLDNRTLACASRNGMILLWEIPT